MKTFLLVMALAVVGCGNGQEGGVTCMVNADCDVGLSCLEGVAASMGTGACLPTGKKTCTKQCVSNDECLKSAPICVTSCGGLKTCGSAAK